jgi:hypothetical protein
MGDYRSVLLHLLIRSAYGRIMSAPRLAYDDASSPAEMHSDCLAAQAALTRPLAVAAVRLSQEQPKLAEMEIPAAAARIAAAMNLQVDGE